MADATDNQPQHLTDASWAEVMNASGKFVGLADHGVKRFTDEAGNSFVESEAGRFMYNRWEHRWEADNG